jgi:hypothetical protein
VSTSLLRGSGPATQLTPEELATVPGSAATTCRAYAPPPYKDATSNAATGPAASSNWKRGNTSTAIRWGMAEKEAEATLLPRR